MKNNVSDYQKPVSTAPEVSSSVLQMTVVPQSHLDKVEGDLDEVKNLLQKKKVEEVNSQWIDSTTARKLLKVSAKTWQEYRNKRVISFSQFGSKIYVKRADLEAFMEEHYITAKKEGVTK